MSVALYLLRHAATSWNEAGRIQGRTDPPLSSAGARQAAMWRLPPDLAGLAAYSSPLVRARQTAAALGLDPVTEPALVELDWGVWEGRLFADIRAERNRLFAAHPGSGVDFAAPNGECARDIWQRLRPWLDDRARSGAGCIAVSHRGVLNAVLALATGWDMRSKPPARLADGCVHRFGILPDSSVTLDLANLSLGARWP